MAQTYPKGRRRLDTRVYGALACARGKFTRMVLRLVDRLATMIEDFFVESGERQHQSTIVVAATIVIGCASMLVFGIEPILLGGLAEVGKLTGAGVGQVAMIETLGVALGSTAGPFVMGAGRIRIKVAAACVSLILVNATMIWQMRPEAILLDRGLAGLFEGLLLGAVSVVLTHNDHPERMSGLLLGFSTIPQVIAAYALPTWLIPRWGVTAGYWLLAAAAGLSLLVTALIVDQVPRRHAGGTRPINWSLPLLVVGLAAVLQSAGIGAAWNYIEQLAAQLHLSPQTVGAAISGSLACQVGGALLAAWLGGRLSARPVLIVGALSEAALVLGLMLSHAPSAFIALSFAFGMFWLALSPFLVAEIIALEPTRTFAMLLTPIGLIGFGAGPLAASYVVKAGDVRPGFCVGAVMLAAAALLYAVSGRPRRTTP